MRKRRRHEPSARVGTIGFTFKEFGFARELP
jgi:hypothetical protein